MPGYGLGMAGEQRGGRRNAAVLLTAAVRLATAGRRVVAVCSSGVVLCGGVAVGCTAHVSTPQQPAQANPQPTSALTPPVTPQAQRSKGGTLHVSRSEALGALCALYEANDLDCDRRLTVLDEVRRCGATDCAEPRRVQIGTHEVGLYGLAERSQLATELADAVMRTTGDALDINLDRALSNPVDYLARRINERYWEGLTRTIEPGSASLWQALRDEKQGSRAELTADWCQNVLTRCAVASAPHRTDPSAAQPQEAHLYVPAQDASALEIYGALEQPGTLRVGEVPRNAGAGWVAALTRERAHGLLTLAYDARLRPLPFVVPGGRFNEMYGWDSFFITWGLLQGDGSGTSRPNSHLALATAMAEHQEYEIRYYGKILNANRTYYLTRSQPPFFAPLVRMVARARQTANASGSGQPLARTVWLEHALSAAIDEYRNVWAAPPRRTELCDGDVCLARYFGQGKGQPPEVEPGHFASMYQSHAVAHGHCRSGDATAAGQRALIACAARLEKAYVKGELDDPQLDEFFVNDRCVRESGHDTTYRWFVDGQERCAQYVSVDLNAVLFRYETDIAQTYADWGELSSSSAWCARARARANLMQSYFWDDEQALFFDYDFVRKRRSSYLSATTLYPLWASVPNVCDVQLVTEEQAQRLVHAALPRLQAPGGLLATEASAPAGVEAPTVLKLQEGKVVRESTARQWEAPNGWAPHQMLAWTGLRQHGFEAEAQQLAYRWLLMIARNAARYHGTVPEKFDVVARSHRVFAEYGNVNTDFSYIAQEGFGWMNASFVVGLGVLTAQQRTRLRRLEEPE